MPASEQKRWLLHSVFKGWACLRLAADRGRMMAQLEDVAPRVKEKEKTIWEKSIWELRTMAVEMGATTSTVQELGLWELRDFIQNPMPPCLRRTSRRCPRGSSS